MVLCAASTLAAVGAGSPAHLRISGIYPHLATFNQPADPADRPNHGECGIGAIVPWADRLWYLSYPQHKTTGSSDKLYEVDPELNLTIRPESVGGTHASRLIHRESNQLILGPYFIDANRQVRAADLQRLRGRMTATMRHLTDPENRVYFFDMEGAIYEVNVHTLAIHKIFEKPVPGFHGKGGYTGQGRMVIANNGEAGNTNAYRSLWVGGPAIGEESGVLAEWDGVEWRIIERAKFCDVTGPAGICGNPDSSSPIWAVGWDQRSVLLKLRDGGQWHTFRLPKASHTFDPDHGWYTEWPRIREIAPGRPMLCMHGALYEFPIDFREADTASIRPIASHLRYIPDFCYWRGEVVLGADDASMMNNPMCGQGQSNLWFGDRDELDHLGPRTGCGGVWRNDTVSAGEPSAPYLFAGYDERVLHLAQAEPQPVSVLVELDRRGDGDWTRYARLVVPSSGYTFHVFSPRTKAEWIRLTTERDCRITAYLHYWSGRPQRRRERRLFSALADVRSPGAYAAGVIRPAAHNRTLQWSARTVTAEGRVSASLYREIDLEGTGALAFRTPEEIRNAEVSQIAAVKQDYTLDAASVVVTDRSGRRWRLPKGDLAFDQTPPAGPTRGVRECVSERFLANFHGTFYEIPRDPANTPDYALIKPVASHNRLITDFCTWRGLLVLCGTSLEARADGQFYADDEGVGLWFGAIDDLWKLGKPVGHGGPWRDTPVQADVASDPYLMTGYDDKRLHLSHTAPGPISFRLEVDFDHSGFHRFAEVTVPPKKEMIYRFPAGYHAHWLRLVPSQTCTATATLVYR